MRNRPALSGGCPGDWPVGEPAYNPGLVRVGLTGVDDIQNSCNRNRNREPLKSSQSQSITFHM